MHTRIVASIALLLLVSAATASAQVGRMLGAGMAVAGAAMLLIDPSQPMQPMQPSVISHELLRGEVDAYLDDAEYMVDRVNRTGDGAFYQVCSVNSPLREAVCTIYAHGAITGAQVGSEISLEVAHRDGRMVHAGAFIPFIPYKERSTGMKYGGAALVIGGAMLAMLWPNPPDALADVSVARTPGGARLSKTFGF